MPLVNMKTLLRQAEAEKRAVGAFSVGNLEMVLGALRAAEETETPIILQIAEVRLPYAPLAVFGPLMVAAAKQANVDVAVHFDHGRTLAAIGQALEIGFTSVMFDGSALPYEENVAGTKAAVNLAEAYGAAIEAELGIVGGSEDGKDDNSVLCTDPAEAVRFVSETGVDALAVAIGNAHGNYPVSPRLRFDVLAELHAACGLPLVLHGGTGITDEDFRRGIGLGIRKINIATANFASLTKGAERYLGTAGAHNYFNLNESMARSVYENIKRHIAIFNNRED